MIFARIAAASLALALSIPAWADFAGSNKLIGLSVGGRYWDRTSGFHRVKVALYR